MSSTTRPPQSWPDKDPDEVLDYGYNWTPRGIGDDTLTDIVATVTSGSVVVDLSLVSGDPVVGIDGKISKVGQGTQTWLSGGTPGEVCLINLHAVSSGGRHLDQTIKIRIRNR